MRLLDRLRPQWRRSDPEVRLAAVRQLGEADQELLHSLAREDDDLRVRHLAVKKLDDPIRLQEIAECEPTESLKALARSRAADIWVERASSPEDVDACQAALSQLASPRDLVRVTMRAHHPSIRSAALARLSEDKALVEVVTKANDPSLRGEALNRLTDPSMLQRIASNGTETQTALAALERIDDVDTLQAIAEERDAHNMVRHRARTRLEQVMPEDHPLRVRARQERQQELCSAAEALLKTVPGGTLGVAWEEASTRLATIREEWNGLAAQTAPDEELRQRLERASQAISEGASRQARRRAEEERLTAERERALGRRVELCEQVESFKDLEEEVALPALEQARTDWHRLDPLPPAPQSGGTEPEEQDTGLEQRFARAVEQCERRIQNWKAEQALRGSVEELLSEAEATSGSKLTEAMRAWSELEKRWAHIEAALESGGPRKLAEEARTRFAAAGEQLTARQRERTAKQQKSRADNLAKLQQLCRRLDELGQSKELSLKAADHALRLAGERLKKIGPLPSGENRKEWKARLAEARRLLFQRFQDQKETEEWKRWANVDQQEKLIQRAEALREVEDLAAVGKELRRIQDEWKRVGAAPRRKSEALWKRFCNVRNELRERCNVYFEENLRKKEALCVEVERLTDSTEWNKTAEAIKAIQAQWKQIGPVPLKQSKAVWRRFRKPCDEFFKRRNEHLDGLKDQRLQNAKKKAELCRQAESLADSTDWEQTAKELKRLQVEWKAIGPAPHKKSEALWNRFRGACDRFFDRRHHRGTIELEDRLAQREAVCVELESLADSLEGSGAPSAGAIREKVETAWKRWVSTGPVPRSKAKSLETRVGRAGAAIAARAPESLHGTALDPRVNQKRREKLCLQLEDLAGPYGREPHRGVEDVAEKLKQALAANTIGGSATPTKKNWKATLQEADRLKANWDRLGPLLTPEDEALFARFQKAYAVLARHQTAEAKDGPSEPTLPSAGVQS